MTNAIQQLLIILVVLSETTPAAVIVPDTLDFGPSRVGDITRDTIRLVPDVSALLVSSIYLDDDRFTLSPNPVTSDALLLSPGESLDIPLAYLPDDPSHHHSQLVIQIDGDAHEVLLKGEGVLESIVVNEILADPPSGLAGDANGDGVRHSSEDEFVELLNITRYGIPIGGWTLSDRGATLSKRFAFPPGTVIAPGARIVLFGGGTPAGIEGQVFVDDGKIGGGLTNSGDAVYLITADGDTAAAAEYGKEAGADQSIVRHPDGRGPFVRHSLPPGTTRFSPGKNRPPISSLHFKADTLRLTLGESVSPMVRAVLSDGDSLDVSSSVLLSSENPSIVVWNADALLATLPGSTTVTAQYDSVVTPPIRIYSDFPPLYTIEPTHHDTIVLKDSEFVLGASVHVGSAVVDLTDILSWQPDDSTLVLAAGPNRFIGARVGETGFHASIESTDLESRVTIAERGDFDLDGRLTAADALRLIHIALEIPPEPFLWEWRGADSNTDGVVDVTDLVMLVDRILGGPRTKPVPILADWEQSGRALTVRGRGIRSVVVELTEPGIVSSASNQWLGAGTLWQARPFTFSADQVSAEVSGLVQDVYVFGNSGWGRARGVGESLRLHAFPNPFNAHTTLSFAVRIPSLISFDIYSVLGQKIAELPGRWREPGQHRVRWDGRDQNRHPVGSGVYIACLRSTDRLETIRLVLLQ